MTMRHFAITQQGASHIARGTNCQDFSATRSLTLEKAGCSAVLCGISDGVGSCAFSEIGSMTAVTTSLDLLDKELAELEELTEANVIPLIKKAFSASVEAIQTRADNDELPFLEFDATLTVAVFVEDGRVFFGHAGDDGIVALYTDGTYEMITHRHKGEESNSVYPLLSTSTWEFGTLTKEAATLAMMTDGVLDKTVGMEQIGSLVYLPMIKSALTHPMTDDEQTTLLKEHWINYLGSAEFRAQATDDLTLVVAQRPAAIPAADQVIFDQTAWDAGIERERQRVDKILSKEREEWARKREGKETTPALDTPPEEPIEPFVSTDDEEELVFRLVTAPPQPEEPAEEPATLVVSEPTQEVPVENPVPSPEVPTLTVPPVPQPTAPQPEAPQPAAPQPEAPQPAAPQLEAPQPAAPQQEAPQPTAPQQEAPQPTAPQQPPKPSPSMGAAAPIPPVQPVSTQKSARGSGFFGQLAKGVVDISKTVARTVTDAGKRVSDKISTDQQQRKDSVPVFFSQGNKPYVVSDLLLQTPTGRFFTTSGDDKTMILRLDDRIFNNASRSHASLERRITALQKFRFDGAVDGHSAFAWPSDILRNNQQEYVGYAVPRIPEMYPLEALWKDCAPGQKFSQYTLKQRCGVAFRLAYMVDMANKNALYVYDFTPQHLVILPKGYTTFIRTDTFCFPTAPGRHEAPLTAPKRFLPPELITAVNQKPMLCSSKTDAFSLALIIHMILSKGQHPFNRGNDDDISQNIVAGYSAHPQQTFPPEVEKLFQAAFGYTAQTACLQATIDSRPSAADWMRVLLDAFNTLPA